MNFNGLSTKPKHKPTRTNWKPITFSTPTKKLGPLQPIRVKRISFGDTKDFELKQQYFIKKEQSQAKKKLLIDILDYDEIYECFNEFHWVDKDVDRDKFSNFNRLFQKTNYVSSESIAEFYKKFHEIKDLQRKGILNKMTASYAFITATQEHLLIPNPDGLLKRKGDENALSFK